MYIWVNTYFWFCKFDELLLIVCSKIAIKVIISPVFCFSSFLFLSVTSRHGFQQKKKLKILTLCYDAVIPYHFLWNCTFLLTCRMANVWLIKNIGYVTLCVWHHAVGNNLCWGIKIQPVIWRPYSFIMYIR